MASSDYPALPEDYVHRGHYESGVLPWLGHIGMSVDPLIHGGYLHELADAYRPDSIDRKDPRVLPLYADLTGLPPILIQVGSNETLLADATRLAAAAGAADVAVTPEVWPPIIHAWPEFNLIEHAQPKEERLKAKAARTLAALDTITAKDARGCFRPADYALH